MSTTPTITENLKNTYTVLGGSRGGDSTREKPLSILLLNRGTRIHRGETLAGMEHLFPAEIISIEGVRNTYDLEPLARKHPEIRFIRLHQAVSLGEYLNIGMEEASGTFVLVVWNDMRLNQISLKVLERISENTGLCTVPVLSNQRNEMVPSIISPGFHHKHLKVLPFVPKGESMLSLYPYDHCGLYRRQNFQLLEGFDAKITNPYWQLLDFGFRAYLWGERIASSNQFRITLTAERDVDDTTPDSGYRRFYLKNLLPRFDKDRGILPKGRFLPYYFRGGASFMDALHEFREIRDWVKLHQYRFAQDAKRIADLWEGPEV